MLTDAQLRAAKAEFDADGFTVLRGFFSADDVQAMEDDVQNYIHNILPNLPENAAFCEVKGDLSTLFRLDRMHSYDPEATQRWMGRDDVTKLAETLIDDAVAQQELQLFGKAPHVGKETPAHQDGYYFKLIPNEALTVWAPLDVCDRGNGCVVYVKGSHKRGVLPHGKSKVFGFSQGLLAYTDEDRELEVAVEVEPGDVIAHHSLTIHRADPNPSDRRRWALGMVYYADRAKVDQAAHDAYNAQVHAQWKEAGRI